MTDSALIADKELNHLFGYEQKLNRGLSTWQLVSFGLMYLQPIGPAVVFGFLLTTSRGTVALPYLFAFLGMIFTVLSYFVLIREFPLSGSVYNYAKIILGPFWGFIAGWLLALDYILIPTITVASAALYAHLLVPSISYEEWLIAFVFSMGFLNLIGIKTSTFFGSIILLVQIIVVILGFYLWIHYIVHNDHSVSHLFSVKPFHFESLTGVIQASSIAIFSFLGFDAVTTMAEESINPRKDIPKAMLICTLIGFAIMFITGYLGVLALPNWQLHSSDSSWINTTLFELAKLSGGNLFSGIYTIGFVLAMLTCNLVGTAAVSRLLYGMGRDKLIPHKIFGVVNYRWKTPHGNILLIMALEIVLGSFANIDQLAELINFGAISGFIILNFCVIFLGYKLKMKKIGLRPSDHEEKFIFRFVLFPVIGLIIIGAIFFNMRLITIIFGAGWGLLGIIILLWNSDKVNISFLSWILKNNFNK